MEENKSKMEKALDLHKKAGDVLDATKKPFVIQVFAFSLVGFGILFSLADQISDNLMLVGTLLCEGLFFVFVLRAFHISRKDKRSVKV